MRARATRLAGSVRDRAITLSRDKSSAPIASSTTRRGAAMVARPITDHPHYTLCRDRGILQIEVEPRNRWYYSSAPNLIQLRAAPVTVKTRCAACGVVHSVVETFFSTCVEMSCPRFAATQSTRQRLRKTEPGVTVPLATRHGVSALPTRKRSRPSRSLTNAAFAAIGCRWIHARSDLAATNSRRPTTAAASSWLAWFDADQVAPGLDFSDQVLEEIPFSIQRVSRRTAAPSSSVGKFSAV